jgi:adenylate cyclase
MIKKAMRLNPYHPDYYERLLAEVAYTARQYEEAIAALKLVKHHVPNSRLTLAASYAQLGQLVEAHAQVEEALQLDPDITTVSTIDVLKNPADQEHWREGLRKAGLPEKSAKTGT